jgi:mannose-1-phosphate guanylyltransferase/phosphomannomutase
MPETMRKINKAAIICGGKGTRLSPLVGNIPKALVKIGKKPLIEHQILLLKKHGLSEIFILAGHLGEQIKDYVRDGRKWNVKISFFQEEKPLGTAGALKTLEGRVKEAFMALSGDVMLDLDLGKFADWHENKRDAIASLAVHRTDHAFDSDLVEIDGTGRIVSFLFRPHTEGRVLPDLSIASVFIFSPGFFRYVPKNEKTDIEKDVLPLFLKSEEAIYGYNTRDYIKDMGTPDRLEKVRHDYDSGKIKRELI